MDHGPLPLTYLNRASTAGLAQSVLWHDDAPLTLLTDAEGGVRYWPAFVPLRVQHDWFHALRHTTPWRSAQRPMYDRIVDVPRLQASAALDDPACPAALHAMQVALRDVLPGVPFNRVGLNLYRDGRDSVALHNDRLHQLAPGQPIALLSLGSPRLLRLRAKQSRGRSLDLQLAPGSLLVMSHACQHTHDHGVPKTSRPVGERISCAFRVRVD